MQVLLLSCMFVRGWSLANLDPEFMMFRAISDYTKRFGWLRSPDVSTVLRWSSELLILCAAGWLIFHNYPVWQILVTAVLLNWWVGKQFINDRRKNDEKKYGWMLQPNEQEMKRNHAAIDAFTLRLSENPDDVEAYWLRADTRTILRDFKGAIDDYTQAIRLSSNDASLYAARGFTQSQLGNHAAAIKDLTAAIALNPITPLNYEWRAHAYQQSGDQKNAQKDFALARQLDEKLTNAIISDYSEPAEKGPSFTSVAR